MEVFIIERTQYAKNGQLVSAVKNYEELTAVEKETLVIPVTNELSDYANFQIRYNKKGELLGVKPHDFSESESAAIEKQTQEPDLIDCLQVLFNKNKHSKQYRSAKKRLGVTNKQINEARKAVNRG